MSRELPPEQARVLAGLDPKREERIAELAERLSIDQSQVAAASVLLAEVALVSVREEPYREWVLKEAGRKALSEGIPERRVLRALLAAGGTAALTALPGLSGLDPKLIGQSLKGLQLRGWARKAGSELEIADAGRLAIDAEDADERALAALAALAEDGRATEDTLVARGVDVTRARELLGIRSPLCEIRDKVHRWVSLTTEGETLRARGVEARREVTQLTPDLLASGEWREVRFKPYDIALATEPVHPGKLHPLRQVLDRTRRVFLEMGFAEVHSPWVESAFWDFDALFQPQDHPAREMQDTFYMERPGKSPLPEDAALVDRVRRVHEDGGDTGSVGWRYRWNPARAEQNVLRTHTTAATIRALAAEPRGPRKVFCLGHVFRRETIDYKHLPVFTQVDGIIIDEAGSFASLLGTLGAFYERMGFSKFYFRPGFFPYTEPSVEVFIWHEAKQDWFEMGGAGVFRPEVTQPLGCTEPVLAWGLGMERLAMLLLDLQDIRELYLADVEWLKGAPRCR